MAIVKDSKAFEADSKHEEHTDSPPPYQPAGANNQASSSTGAPPDLPPPTNYLVIKREHNSIRETYAIDAGLSRPIPEAATEQSIWANIFKGKDAARPVKNLLVASTHGSVDVNVWLVGEFYRDRPAAGTSIGGSAAGEQLQGRRAELDISSVHGSVTAKLNTATTRPYALRVFSKYGSVTVGIPRNFVGPVTLRTTHGSIRVSDALATRLSTFSETDGARECFVGNADGYHGKDSWTGCVIDVGSYHSRVRLAYVGDEDLRGFWDKLFGGLF